MRQTTHPDGDVRRGAGCAMGFKRDLSRREAGCKFRAIRCVCVGVAWLGAESARDPWVACGAMWGSRGVKGARCAAIRRKKEVMGRGGGGGGGGGGGARGEKRRAWWRRMGGVKRVGSFLGGHEKAGRGG